MKSKKNKKRLIAFIIIPLSLLLFMLLLINLLPFSTLNYDVYQGVGYLDSKQPYLAAKYFEDAEKRWPILLLNADFQIKKEKAIALRTAYIANTPLIDVFLDYQTTSAEIEVLKNKILELEGVSKVTFLSKEEALSIYRERNKDNETLLSLVTADILPASYRVFMSDPSKKSSVAKMIKELSGVEEVVEVQLAELY